METKLPYTFKRRSANFFEWLSATIKSEKYHMAESIIVDWKDFD